VHSLWTVFVVYVPIPTRTHHASHAHHTHTTRITHNPHHTQPASPTTCITRIAQRTTQHDTHHTTRITRHASRATRHIPIPTPPIPTSPIPTSPIPTHQTSIPPFFPFKEKGAGGFIFFFKRGVILIQTPFWFSWAGNAIWHIPRPRHAPPSHLKSVLLS
jgi:hypothetical protein